MVRRKYKEGVSGVGERRRINEGVAAAENRSLWRKKA